MDITQPKKALIDVDAYWIFPNDKVVRIDEMNKKQLMSAALHTAKQIKRYNSKQLYFEYKEKVAEKEKDINKARKQQASSIENLNYFMNKFEHIEARASDFGIELPETVDEIRKLTA